MLCQVGLHRPASGLSGVTIVPQGKAGCMCGLTDWLAVYPSKKEKSQAEISMLNHSGQTRLPLSCASVLFLSAKRFRQYF